MAFGLPGGGGGDIMPFVKYNAKAGKFFRVDRVQTASGWETTDVDITHNFAAVFDLEEIQVGFVYFGPNGPQRAMATYMKAPVPPRPVDVDDKGKPLYKGGFVVTIALAKDCGGGIREFSSSAQSVQDAMNALYDVFARDPANANRTAAPIVKLVTVQAEKGSFGTNYRPVFEIVGWVDRASLFKPAVPATNGGGQTAALPFSGPAQAPAQQSFTQTVAPPATGAQQVQPPPPMAAPPPPQQAAQQFGAAAAAPASAAGDFG